MGAFSLWLPSICVVNIFWFLGGVMVQRSDRACVKSISNRVELEVHTSTDHTTGSTTFDKKICVVNNGL
ncbi:hypothetical protein BDV38DRAFT_236166 [Aspergillus pseudotamarii]|uniref:Uncharacterized protein n=1 Tax=Aspergillus pseudotamarii TaxID=132259 RepID=A0A5N6T7G8_ASPPS|nr:uncharacterized protein BDV38DRAFT_236166 [Aspergillus pseudotamarii]KAE8142232.1 hypothetical protein BDV38DRAFT_236166 [Aspergillus pseudotamarii]